MAKKKEPAALSLPPLKSGAKTMTMRHGSKIYVIPGKSDLTGKTAYHIYATTPNGDGTHHAFLVNETLDAIVFLRDLWESEENPQPTEHTYAELPERKGRA